MCGVTVHIDPTIGKWLGALGSTLTTFTGEEDADDIADFNSAQEHSLSEEEESEGVAFTVTVRLMFYLFFF